MTSQPAATIASVNTIASVDTIAPVNTGASIDIPAPTAASVSTPASSLSIQLGRTGAKNSKSKSKKKKKEESSIVIPKQAPWIKTPEETKFLVDQYMAFLALQHGTDSQSEADEKASADFWTNLYREFFKKWPNIMVPTDVLALFSNNLEKAKAAMKKDKEDKIYMWYYNHQRGQKGEVAREPNGLRIPTTAPKMLSAVQMYSRMFYDEKVQDEVNRRWSEQHETRIESEEGGAEVAGETTTRNQVIPVAFKMRVAEGLYELEPPEVQQLVESRRYMEMRPVDEEEDETHRIERLESFASGIKQVTKPCENFMGHLSNKTGWHTLIITGGPDPSDGGRIKIFSYTHGTIKDGKQDFRGYLPGWSKLSDQYGDYLHEAFPPEIRAARALPEVSQDASGDESMEDAPPIKDSKRRKRGRPRKTSYRNTEALYPEQEQTVPKPPKNPKKVVTSALDPLVLEDAISLDVNNTASSSPPATTPPPSDASASTLPPHALPIPSEAPQKPKKMVTFALDPLLKDAISFDDDWSPPSVTMPPSSAPTLPPYAPSIPPDAAPKPASRKAKRATPKLAKSRKSDTVPTTASAPTPSFPVPNPSPPSPPVPVPSPPVATPLAAVPTPPAPVPSPPAPVPSPPAPVPSPPAPVPSPPAPVPSPPAPVPSPPAPAPSPPTPAPLPTPPVPAHLQPVPQAPAPLEPVSIPASPIPPATVSASAVKKGSKKKTSLIDNLVMPSWLIMALKYLEPLANTDGLKDLMRSLVDFERSQDFERGSKTWIEVKDCPAEFSVWQIKMKSPPATPPIIEDFDTFLQALRHWWVTLQPNWRKQDTLSKQLPDSPVWDGLKIGGPCGVYCIVTSLAWCIDSCGNQPIFTSLVDDVIWALGELVKDDEAGGSRRRPGRAVATSLAATRGTKRPSEGTKDSRKRVKK